MTEHIIPVRDPDGTVIGTVTGYTIKGGCLRVEMVLDDDARVVGTIPLHRREARQ